MSIEQSIHRYWSSCRDLCERAPADRFFSGQAAPDSAWPYVTLEQAGASRSEHTSSATRIELVPLRFNVWDQRLDRAQQLAERIVARFDRCGAEGGDERLLDLCCQGALQEQQPDGVWRVRVDFIARLVRPAINLR
jgi:hypothetical protein